VAEASPQELVAARRFFVVGNFVCHFDIILPVG